MMKTRMTQTAKDMGYSTGLIRAVIHQRWNTTRKTFANTEDLLDDIFVAESEGIEPEDDPVLPEEGITAAARKIQTHWALFFIHGLEKMSKLSSNCRF